MSFHELKKGIGLSLLIHVFFFGAVFLAQYRTQPTEIAILPNIGSQIRFLARFRNPGKGDSPYQTSSATTLGATDIQEEILRLRKSIFYPPSALERGLESDCEWIVTVAENHKFKKLEEVQKCKYSIFDRAFREALQDWEFNLPPGTKIRIPVSFRIEHE
jgi:outer membrane biosynthesis protein TonB